MQQTQAPQQKSKFDEAIERQSRKEEVIKLVNQYFDGPWYNEKPFVILSGAEKGCYSAMSGPFNHLCIEMADQIANLLDMSVNRGVMSRQQALVLLNHLFEGATKRLTNGLDGVKISRFEMQEMTDDRK